MHEAIELYAAVNLLVIGLSHLLLPRIWVDGFIRLRSLGLGGVFLNGMLSLSFGSLIVAFHNVWSGLPIVLTIFGWLQVAKGLVSLTVPQWGMRSLERVSPERANEFVAGGAIFLVLSAFMWYLVFTR
jgi:hypothetical protein